MPKRSTEFQNLVSLLEHQLAPEGATVTQSKELVDAITGERREVDIVIESKQGIHPVIIGVEVIEHKRKATTPWIESIAKKHEHLPVNKTICVSMSGFYLPALKKAASCKIDALTPEDISSINWKSTLKQFSGLKITSFIKPYATGATVLFRRPVDVDRFKTENLENAQICDPDMNSLGTLDEFVTQCVNDENIVSHIKTKLNINGRVQVDLVINNSRGDYFLVHDGKAYQVGGIEINIVTGVHISDLEYKKISYSNTPAVIGTGMAFGRKASIVLSQRNSKEDIKFTLHIEKPKSSTSKKSEN